MEGQAPSCAHFNPDGIRAYQAAMETPQVDESP